MQALNYVATLVSVPPVNFLLLALVGFTLLRRRLGRLLLGLGLLGILIFSLPITSALAFLVIENYGSPPPGSPPPGAIVILSGDVKRMSDEVGAFDVGPLTLERMRAGVVLQRSTGLPVLVSGGGPIPIAKLMARSLEADFLVPARWQENDSRDTWENARESARLLRPMGIQSIFLVTHAWHMRRALIAFGHFGMVATPYPVPFSRALYLQPALFIPSANGWAASYYAFHELIGCAWYSLWARP